MTPLPPTRLPTRLGRPSRPPSGRRWVRIVSLVVVTAACSPALPPVPASGALAPSSVIPSPPPPSVEGLYVASGGILRVTDADGVLGTVPDLDATLDGSVTGVSTGSGAVLALAGPDALLGEGSEGGHAWRSIELPADPGARANFAALSPDGRTVAVVRGALQGGSLTLDLVDVTGGAGRSIAVERGLDGPPVWIGPSLVAIRTIRPGGGGGFSQVDLRSGTVTDLPGSSVTLSAAADGERVAIDDPATGDVLVGPRDDLAPRLDGLTRLTNRSGFGVETIALDGDGRRLAIVRPTDAGMTIELLVDVGGEWQTAGSLVTPGDGPIAIAWRR